MISVERTNIVDGTNSFMDVNHLRIRGKQEEIGEFLAKESRHHLGASKPPIDDPLAARAQRRFMSRNWPAHYRRMQGAAAELGIAGDDRYDVSYLNYDVGAAGCSVVFYPGSVLSAGGPLLSRNFDFTTAPITSIFENTGFEMAGINGDGNNQRPAAGRPYIFELYADEGIPCLYMCAYELLGSATDGVNAEGLAVALMMDVGAISDSRRWEPNPSNLVGLSEIQIPRFVLETCSSASEAREALLSTQQSYSFAPAHYLVCDDSGDAFVWEYSLSRNVPRITECDGTPMVCTNHLIFDDYEVPDDPATTESVARHELLSKQIESRTGLLSREDVRACNDAVQATENVGEGQYISSDGPARTLWYSLYDLTERSLTVDFYLGEEAGIQRSNPVTIGLDC